MSLDRQDNIGNAAQIIERFGGIRPMATKMGVAVTTIQGWKQRNSIPAGRREDLIEAAKANDIRIDDLLDGSFGESVSGVAQPIQQEVPPVRRDVEFDAPRVSQAAQDNFSRDIRPPSQLTTLVIAGVLILAAAVIGIVFAIAPKVHSLTAQEQRIAELEQELQTMKSQKEEQSFSLPEDYKASLSQLQNKVGELAEQAQGYQTVIDGLQQDLQNGSMQQRMAQIETRISQVVDQAKAMGLQDMMYKIQLMQQSAEGSTQLNDVVASLVQVVSVPDGAGGDVLAVSLDKLRETDPKVAEAFQDVAPEDMKAAAMLLGMSQLRQSLARDRDSFDQDLALLKETVAKDDPVLAQAIDRLAPKAKSGVLTPDGLSNELRAMTGEIVSASLSGQDVSIEDQALARFGNLVKVEKDGQQISGTETQILVAEAQKKLDQGDVEGALVLLQSVQGPAAQKTRPIIDAAQATVYARQVQEMIGQKLLSQLSSMGGGTGQVPYVVNGGASGSMDRMMNNFKSFTTGQ